jgi:hypothetical protein
MGNSGQLHVLRSGFEDSQYHTLGTVDKNGIFQLTDKNPIKGPINFNPFVVPFYKRPKPIEYDHFFRPKL